MYLLITALGCLLIGCSSTHKDESNQKTSSVYKIEEQLEELAETQYNLAEHATLLEEKLNKVQSTVTTMSELSSQIESLEKKISSLEKNDQFKNQKIDLIHSELKSLSQQLTDTMSQINAKQVDMEDPSSEDIDLSVNPASASK